MLLVDLNYNFECDWFVELSDNKLSDNKLSDNKLSDNNLASESVGNRSFFKLITIEEIVIFMINLLIMRCFIRYKDTARDLWILITYQHIDWHYKWLVHI